MVGSPSEGWSLWYGDVRIGDLHRVTTSDGTWYGLVDLVSGGHASDDRAMEYARFCTNWNSRERADLSPSAREFDAYADVTDSGQWQVRSGDGRRAHVDRAPVFFPDREVTWSLR
jgi:hypothetical protein